MAHESTMERDPLEILADEFAAKCRAGESPSVSDYVARLPERADEIRELFPSVAMMERLRHDEDQERTVLASAQKPTRNTPLRIGDYQILREIGCGGMGIVYESIQSGLERRVALKVMNAASVASPRQVQRFEREARAAAGLHHTNIVPVFAVGNTDGRHYYAMQFIDGVGLDEVVAAMRNATSPDAPESEVGPVHTQRTGNKAVVTASALKSGTYLNSCASGSKGTYLHRRATGGDQQLSGVHSPPAAPQESSDINDRPTLKPGDRYWKSVALIGVQVANALHYAHSHGVLHRDIKPQNLLIDREGNVWVTDFGLVKLMEHDDITKTGDIVGTLGYMAPEQFKGEGDRTSDVFSLGLTLYELLTLTPAWSGARNAVAARRLNNESFPAPRRINRDIPRDLETIILKATSSARSSRYTTADELAQDLQRFIEDRPVLARRASSLERLVRWSRRNPALAVAFSAVATLLIMIAAMATRGRMRVEELLTESQIARARAEQTVDHAIEAFDSIVENVSARGVPQSLTWSLEESQLTLSDARLLEQLLAFYTAFAADNANHDRLNGKLADALRQAGEIQIRLGHLSDAEESYRRAHDRYRLLVKRSNPSEEHLRSFAATLNDLGNLLLQRGQFQQAFESHLEARDFLLNQPAAMVQQPDFRFEMARSVDLLASISIRSGVADEPRQASAATDGSDVVRQSVTARPTASAPEHLKDFPGIAAEAQSQGLADAVRQFELLVHDFPNNDLYQVSLARCLRHQLSHATLTGDDVTAGIAFRDSIRILELLVQQSPEHPTWLYELTDTLIHGATLDDPFVAEQHLDRAVTSSERLFSRYPNVTEYRLLRGSAFARLAIIQDAIGARTSAKASHQSAVKILTPLIDDYPDNGVYQIAVAQARRNLADHLLVTGSLQSMPDQNATESLTLLETAIADFDSYLDGVEWNSFTAQLQSSLYESLADSLTVLGRFDEATSAWQQADFLRMMLP